MVGSVNHHHHMALPRAGKNGGGEGQIKAATRSGFCNTWQKPIECSSLECLTKM